MTSDEPPDVTSGNSSTAEMAANEGAAGMADENTPPEPETGTDTTEDTSGLKSALEKERDARKAAEKEARENRSAAKRLAEIEESNKSEQEKLADQLSQATKERDEAITAAARLRVAVTKGVPADLVDRLRGDTEDELAEDADKLLALVAKDERPRPPAPDPRQGGNGGGQLSTAQQFAAALEGQL